MNKVIFKACDIAHSIIDWFQDHDKITHFLGAFLMMFIVGLVIPYAAIPVLLFWFAIEIVQWFKWATWDYWDFVADIAGVFVGYLILHFWDVKCLLC